MNEQLSFIDEYYYSSAVISACGKYRYTLWRKWEREGEIVTFVCLNPSTADGYEDDATVRRCIGYAKTWGFSGLCMANLFAFRATKPEIMRKALDPIGPENDGWLKELCIQSKIVVAGWGPQGQFMGRDRVVKDLFGHKLHYLELSKQGYPKHPLYLKKCLELKKLA